MVCKLLEMFVKKAFMEHLVSNSLLSSKQFGFTGGRSTVTQLLNYLDKCIEKIVAGKVVNCIYLDFSKAFDTVPHKRFSNKLKGYGISGELLNWIKAFLSDRTQTVKVNGVSSATDPVMSGTLPSSVLGPVLFIIFINDVLDNVQSDGFLFADDTKVFRSVESKADAEALQADINALEEWSNTWLLRFNPKKCHVLSLGRIEDTMYTMRYKVYDKEMEHVFDEKDLGVTIDSQLTFV